MPPVISYLRDEAPASCETRVFTCGVTLIAIGGVFAFLTLAIAYVLALGAVLGGGTGLGLSGDGVAAVLVPVLLLTTAAVMCIWTGIGSVRLRRWCRPIVICLSALTACEALLLLLNLALQRYFLPDAAPALVRRAAPGGPPPGIAGPSTEYTIAVLTTFAALAVVLPFLFFLAYRGQDVERTLDEADPNLYWTDRCDMPTLAFALVMLQGAYLSILMLPFVLASRLTTILGHAFGPMHAALFFILGAALCVIAARLVHMQSRIGPWLAMLITLTASASVVGYPHAETPPVQGFTTYGPTPDDQFLSRLLTATVYAIPAILFALWVLRLRRQEQHEPPQPLPRAIVLDMPLSPLPLEPPPLAMEQFLVDEARSPIADSLPILR